MDFNRVQKMNKDIPIKSVFFFGAGASVIEGAPIASKLLTEAFQEFPTDGKVNRVKDFLKDFYLNDCADEETIPTFEEILSPIDICLQKQEQFSDKWNYEKLSELRNDLIYCICTILHERLYTQNIHHQKLVDNLFSNGKNWEYYSFVSLNYDILLDNALIRLAEEERNDYADLDYGIEFRNEGTDWRRPRAKRVYLLKLHGSLNWLYCPTCNTVKITPKEKGVMRIFTHSEVCENDFSMQKALIVPPTWQKVYDNPYLVSIWLRAEQILRNAERIFFIGYSMPEADIHIKYLLKKSLFRRCRPHPKIVIIDKEDHTEYSNEYRRYRRLFGETEYHPIGFENFATNVGDYL